MKEQLINFETAKLAKEKGFDVEVLNHYTQEDCLGDGYHSFQDDLKNSELEHFEYSAPAQSLLQKWLREVHKIDIYIIGYGFGYYAQLNNVPPANQGCIKYIDRRWNIPPKEENSGDLRDYEDALEKELQEALKLI